MFKNCCFKILLTGQAKNRIDFFVRSMVLCFAFTNVQAQQLRKIVWSEEFNYTGLPDTTKWAYEEGFVRNGESQYYTKARSENIFVHDGVLEIKAIKETFKNTAYNKNGTDWRVKDSLAQYTSASINTLGKAAWKYGRIEVRAKIPHGLGVWPAVWMKGENWPLVHWPACGEIDIMEFVGHDSTSIFGSIHFTKTGVQNNHGSSHSKIEVTTPYNDFHLYAMEWDSTAIKIFFDDKLYHSFEVANADDNNENPFRKPFYLLINLALGGTWGGKIDAGILPQSYLIDYIRVYQ